MLDGSKFAFENSGLAYLGNLFCLSPPGKGLTFVTTGSGSRKGEATASKQARLSTPATVQLMNADRCGRGALMIESLLKPAFAGFLGALLLAVLAFAYAKLKQARDHLFLFRRSQSLAGKIHKYIQDAVPIINGVISYYNNKSASRPLFFNSQHRKPIEYAMNELTNLINELNSSVYKVKWSSERKKEEFAQDISMLDKSLSNLKQVSDSFKRNIGFLWLDTAYITHEDIEAEPHLGERVKAQAKIAGDAVTHLVTSALPFLDTMNNHLERYVLSRTLQGDTLRHSTIA